MTLVFAPPEIRQLAVKLLHMSGVLQINIEKRYEWEGGFMSPFYLQGRDITSAKEEWPKITDLMAELYHCAVNDYGAEPMDGIFGVPTGAVTLSGALGYALRMRVARIQEFKGYGINQPLLGLRAGQRAWVCEDITSTGGAIVTKGAEPLRAHGVEVKHGIAMASNEAKVAENLSNAGIIAFALCASADIIKLELASHDASTRRIVEDFQADPRGDSDRWRSEERRVGKECRSRWS